MWPSRWSTGFRRLIAGFRQTRSASTRPIGLSIGADLEALGEDGATPSSLMQNSKQVDHIRMALTQLSPEHRRVLQLRVRDGLPFDDVAGQLSLSSDAARQLFGRTKHRLLEELQKL